MVKIAELFDLSHRFALNVKSDKTLAVVHGEELLETGLKKVGAMLGDHVEIG